MSFFTELLQGFFRLWLNPVFYMIVLLSFILGASRVRRERHLFRMRVNDMITDVYNTVIPGLACGFFLSVVFLGLGFVLPQGALVLLMVVMLLFSLPLRPLLLTPALTMFVAVVAAYYLPLLQTGHALVDRWLIDMQATRSTSYFLLLAFLVMVEALLLLRQANRKPSPRRIRSKRGKAVGGFMTKRMWLVPAFIVVPGSGLERLDWWPLLGDANGFTFVLVPFVIGFQQFVTHTLPERAIVREGKVLLIYAVLLLPVAILSTLYEWTLLASLGMGLTLIVRFVLFAVTKWENRTKPFSFTERNDGVKILGIISHTPAAHMNLHIGEVIRKVNGIPVQNGYDFYQALQANAAFCKLEVLDENGEVRFEQRALYADEHHELGLLFVS